MQNQRKLNLKNGDIAYFLNDVRDYRIGQVYKVKITGECEEGNGYAATSLEYAKEWSNDGEMHTCNGLLFKTKKEARIESITQLRKARIRWAKEQAKATKMVQYIDWVLYCGGRFNR